MFTINTCMENSTCIVGQRTDGTIFRPFNWTARVASVGANFKDKRLRYSEHLIPCVHNGIPSLIMSEDLSADVKDFVLEFATSNGLKIEKITR